MFLGRMFIYENRISITTQLFYEHYLADYCIEFGVFFNSCVFYNIHEPKTYIIAEVAHIHVAIILLGLYSACV